MYLSESNERLCVATPGRSACKSAFSALRRRVRRAGRLGAACAFARCRHGNAASKSQVALRGACCSRAWVLSLRSAPTLASLRLAGPWGPPARR